MKQLTLILLSLFLLSSCLKDEDLKLKTVAYLPAEQNDGWILNPVSSENFNMDISNEVMNAVYSNHDFLLLVLMDMPINDKEMICKYFVFLNPAHSMKFIGENKEITEAAIPIDFIGRIVVSYAIYQFIVAFQKHTKKNSKI